jgi:ureidoglycolate hydrolase
MLDLNPQYKTDADGNRQSVTLTIKEWHQILNALQELEMMRVVKKDEDEENQKEKAAPNEYPGFFG